MEPLHCGLAPQRDLSSAIAKKTSSALSFAEGEKADALPAPYRVLIVDDEKDLVDIISLTLEKKGYRSIRAYDGKEGWEKVLAELPDLLILDVLMPEMDGWELCRMIRRSEKPEIRNLPVLMLSARAMPEDRIKGLEMGADDYLTKPFSLAELVLRVEGMQAKNQAFKALYHEMDQLRGQMRRQEESLNSVIHDLKTPLVSMGASAKVLMRGKPEGENIDFLRSIYENSLRLTRMIEEILLLADLNHAQMLHHCKAIEPAAIGKRVFNLLSGVAREKGIEMRWQAAPSIPLIAGNEEWIEKALENLVANALKFTPPGGSLDISIRPSEKGGVQISVHDSGIGISTEDQGKIFEPFYRGKNAFREKGIGLGLAMVKRIANLHGGEIIVKSELNKGSLFILELPTVDSIQKGGKKKEV